MIQQYTFLLTPLEEKRRLTASHAYRLYGWMMEQVPEEYGAMLHSDGFTPISQYLVNDREHHQGIWKVSLLNDEVIRILSDKLQTTKTLNIDQMEVKASLQNIQVISEASDLLRQNTEENRHVNIEFLSPTSFKIQGHYAIFPDIDHIVSSLAQQCNEVFPEISVTDEDALTLLKQGLYISDYRLQGSRFYMKNNCIYGFSGRITVTSHLAAPMQEIWRMLLQLANFTGVGIKTTLGMGGIKTTEPVLRRKA